MSIITISDPKQLEKIKPTDELSVFLKKVAETKIPNNYIILQPGTSKVLGELTFVFDMKLHISKERHDHGARLFISVMDEGNTKKLISGYNILPGRFTSLKTRCIESIDVNEVTNLNRLLKEHQTASLDLAQKPYVLGRGIKAVYMQSLRKTQVIRETYKSGSLISINNGSSLSAFFVSNQNQVTPVPSIEHTLNNDNRADPELLASLMTFMMNIDDLGYFQTSKGHIFYNQSAKEYQIIKLNYDVGFTQNAKGELILKFIDSSQSIAGDDPAMQGKFNQGIHPVVFHGKYINGQLTIKPEGVKEGYLPKLVKIGLAMLVQKEMSLLQLLQFNNAVSKSTQTQTKSPYRASYLMPIPGTKSAAMYMRHFQGVTLNKFIKDILPQVPSAQKQAVQMQLAKLLSASIAQIHQKVVHRDLKSENTIVTLDPDDSMRVTGVWPIDFGFSDVLANEKAIITVGSLVYCAPEGLAQLYKMRNKHAEIDNAYDKTTRFQDIWSLAVMFIEIFAEQEIDTHFQAFTKLDPSLIDAAKNILLTCKENLATNFSEEFREKLIDMLTQMMDLDWTQRPTSEKVLGMVNKLSAVYDKDIALKAHKAKVEEYRGKRKSSPPIFFHSQAAPIKQVQSGKENESLTSIPIIPCF